LPERYLLLFLSPTFFPLFAERLQKTYRQRKTKLSKTLSATGERAAVPQVASRRILCVVIGIRDHRRERIADPILSTVWRCQISGAAKEPEKFSVFHSRVTPRI
jgi:hypothetical protein